MPLLERTDELDRLDALAEAAVEGGGSVAILEGQAGIGKTTLLEAATVRAVTRGLRVLRSRAGQLEHEVGWNVVRQLFGGVIRADRQSRRRLLRDAAALAEPALGLSEGSDAGSLHGLYWLTEGLCEQSPLLLAVDDAQWADDASLGYLAYLSERVQDLPLAMVVTVRAGEDVPEALTVLMSRPAAHRIRLHELSPAAGAELVREALGPSASEAFCAACYEATSGNPFLLRELLGQLASDGVEPSSARAPEVARITPETVRRSVLLRLSRFSPDARKLAAAVAALGEGRLHETAAVASVDIESAANLADGLAGAGILSPGAPLRFVHAIVREAIFGELPPLERARLHRRAAEVLAAHGDHRRAAAQLLETVPEADPWVVSELTAAADAATTEGAPAIAASLLRRAVLEPPRPHELPGVLVALGRAEAASGGAAAAERMTEAAELVAEPRRRAEIQLHRGRLLYLAGRIGDAARAFDDGLQDLAADGRDPSLEAELRAGWLTVARLEVPLRRRAEEMTHAIAANPPAGGSYGERALLAHVAGQLTFDGEPRERGIELAYRALGDGELIRQETSDGLSWVVAMGALGWGDDFDGFDALQREAIADARRRGSVLGYATAMYGSNFTHYYGGVLGDAVDDARRAIDAERDGWRHFLTASRAQLAWALIELGELEAADAQLDQAEVDAALEEISAQALVREARARIQLIRGDPAAALRSALAAGELFTHNARISNPSILPWRSRAAIAAGAMGDRERAEELVSEELELARRYGAPRPIGVALTAAGTVRRGDGVPALEEAVALLESSPARLEHTRALVMLGAALRRKGRLGAARDVLERGLADAASFGASVLEERARLELAAAGVRPQRRRRSGAEALTAAERRVAEAATEGLSNREIAQSLFVSLRTVETHLTHVYQKLGIQGRAELAAALSGPAA